METREKFGSRIGFLLVSAGCAVGLGNVWKFPYICGINGGAAFIVIYLIFLLFLGYPIILAEYSIGRGSGKGVSQAFNVLEPKGTHWHNIKWFCMAGNYLLMMFYTMVGGWMLYYAYLMIKGEFAGLDNVGVRSIYDEMLSKPFIMILWMIIVIVVSFLVCSVGLKNGIERISKVIMTALLVLIVILAINSVVLPNSFEGIKFYLIPDFKKMSDRGYGNIIFDAMTHAFFTLSVGIGSMEIFGSYLGKDRSIFGEARNVVFLDTLVALLAGFIIIPACFAFGVEPDAGPSLLFVTLPNVFNGMPGGRIWGTAFFIFMSFAALSTVIAVFENILSFYMDMGKWSRKKAVAINIPLIIVLSVPAVLGFNLLSGVQPLGPGTTIMDLEDFLVSYNALPLGALVFVLFCTKRNGWGYDNFIKEAETGKGLKIKGRFIRQYMEYVLSNVIVVIYLKGYYETFKGFGTGVLIGWMTFGVVLLVAIFMIVSKKPKTVK